MATSSFDKHFEIKDPKATDNFWNIMQKPAKPIERRTDDKSGRDGSERLLKQLRSRYVK